MSLEYRSFSEMSNCYQWTLQKAMSNRLDDIQPHRRLQTSFINKTQDSNQIVRKSRRLEEKEKRMAESKSSFTQLTTSKNKKFTKKLEEEAQFQRSLTQRLSNPKILSNIEIMWRDGAFWYSIDVKYDEPCEKHLQKSEDLIQEQKEEGCLKCIKEGTFWFKQDQLRKFNNGTYWRKFIEKHIF